MQITACIGLCSIKFNKNMINNTLMLVHMFVHIPAYNVKFYDMCIYHTCLCAIIDQHACHLNRQRKYFHFIYGNFRKFKTNH